MKKYFLYIAAAAFLMAACTKEPILKDPPEEPVTGIITMTTQASEVEVYIRYLTYEQETDNLIIDWGDGEGSQTYATLPDDPYYYLSVSHNYSGASEHHITITGDNIEQFWCNNQKITALDVSRNPNLKQLYCFGSQLTTLDVSRNTALTDLHCDNNQLTTLDVSGATALRNLYCKGNQLTKLDMSSNTGLTRLNCINNQLTASALNDLFRSLHIFFIYSSTKKEQYFQHLWIYDNPGTSDCDVSIAEEKGWTVMR